MVKQSALRRWSVPAALLTAYMFLVMLPLILAAVQGLEPRPWLDDLATGLAMAGFAMLLMEFLLSGRFKVLSALVGMDRVMRFHQVMAYVLVVFLLFHPFLYTLPMGVAQPLDVDGHSWLQLPLLPGLSGLIAWLALGVFVFAALARDDLPGRYEIWRLSHGVGAVLIALFALHHTLDAGRYSQDPILAGFWILAVALAVASLAHVYLVIPLQQRRHPFRVAAVLKEADRTWTLELEPATDTGHSGAPLRYKAGQFAWLKLHRPLFRLTEHPFSMSSAPADWPRIAFTIKEAGDFTNEVGSVPLGTPAYLDGPYGHFVLNPTDTRPLVLVAGGVGMAAIMALLRELRARESPRPALLIQGNRVAGQLLFDAELREMAQELNLEIHHVLSEPHAGWSGHRGIPNQALLQLLIPREKRRGMVYYLCGPPGMIDSLETILLSDFGVPAGQVISERFRNTLGSLRGSGRFLQPALGAALVIALGTLWFALR